MLAYIIAAVLVLPIIYVLWFTDKVSSRAAACAERSGGRQRERSNERQERVQATVRTRTHSHCALVTALFPPRCVFAVCAVELPSSLQLPPRRVDGRIRHEDARTLGAHQSRIRQVRRCIQTARAQHKHHIHGRTARTTSVLRVHGSTAVAEGGVHVHRARVRKGQRTLHTKLITEP